MKTSVTIELKTREAYQLFMRKINGDRLFINAVLHKLNKITGLCRKEDPAAVEHFQVIEKNLFALNQQFKAENKKFQKLLQKEEYLKNKKITFKTQFFPQINIENPLAMDLLNVFESFDSLMAIIKLLYLAGCFKSSQDYHSSIQKAQKTLNRTLSQIILMRSNQEGSNVMNPPANRI